MAMIVASFLFVSLNTMLDVAKAGHCLIYNHAEALQECPVYLHELVLTGQVIIM